MENAKDYLVSLDSKSVVVAAGAGAAARAIGGLITGTVSGAIGK